jgi:glycerol-3-phosphate acyltransferase PlsY
MLGHVYPLWFGWRGGKAVATMLGAILGLAPLLLFPVALAWLAAAVLTGFVSVASIAAAAMLPVAVVAAGLAWRTPLLGFGLVSAVLVLFTHRANLRRLRAGSEPRAERLWWFGLRAPS